MGGYTGRRIRTVRVIPFTRALWYDSIIEHSPKSSADFVESITYRTYDSLYDKRASAGNELASSDSSSMLGLGYLSNIIGSTLLKDGKAGAKKLLDGPKKNIPS